MDSQSNDKKRETMAKGKYLNPKADLTFKLVFGEHPDLVMSLLNALLPIAEDNPIVSVEYQTSELVPENKGKKDSIVDVRCKDSSGRQFIVEMQMYWNEDFKKRVLLNASKAVVKQVNEGENYQLIEPVFSLNLINDDGFQPDTDEFYHDYAVLNVAHPERTIDGLRFVFVELPKFQPKSIAEKKMAVLWLRFLTEISESTQEAPAELLENEQTRKALSIVEKSAMTEAQLYAYERFMLSIVDERVIIEGSYKKGIAEGMKKGMAEAEERRIKERLQNARSLKENGVALDIIVQSLGLTESELNQL